jgi:undecaprenyl-diphosphatase
MSFLHIILLSLIQGITEFLPISSSAHLILLPFFLDFPDQGIIMDVAVHIGTLLAVMIYFFKEIRQLFIGFFHLITRKESFERRLLLIVIIATLPVVIGGFALHKYGTDELRNIKLIGWTTLIFGIFLGVFDKYSSMRKEFDSLTYTNGFWIGMSQILALIPGVSRSGITMTAARALGFDRISAARFSLLISIPTIAGAGLLEALDLIKINDITITADAGWSVLLSFLSSLIVIAFLIKWLQKHSFLPFMIYRIALGGGLLLYAYNLI